MKINVLWFKRDFRIQDNEALLNACKQALPVLCLYIYEIEQECHYDFDIRHWQFIKGSIKAISDQILINEVYGDPRVIFKTLLETYEIQNVFSMQETGVYFSYMRDLDLKEIFKQENIVWHEFQNNGVLRGLKNRNTWDAAWINYMTRPIEKIDITNVSFIESKDLLEKFALSFELQESVHDYEKWKPGIKHAEMALKTFVSEKIDDYFKYISMPDKSRYHCSRLSQYISWGNLSVRQIYQYTYAHKRYVKNKKSADQFLARLKWHCHFIQKLEMEPEMEWKNQNKIYDDIRKKKNKRLIKAWSKGETGYPLIDAAMKCVSETGYLNFRLRATVVSFLTHHLWQPWQVGAKFLAKQFIDYEPGIHYCQFQMQAGTTGIHTIRIYNPVKQSKEKDKDAVFLKKWLPELSDLPVKFIHEPWLMTEMEQIMYGVELGRDYPKRIIDHEKKSQEARDQLWGLKKSDASKKNAMKILKKHTRRKRL